MTRAIVVLAMSFAPVLVAAQSPVVTSGATARVVGASEVKLPTGTPNNGGATSATVSAENTLNSIKRYCQLATRAEKLVATCDDTTQAGRAEQLQSQTPADWGKLAMTISDADATLRGKRRAVVVVNRSDLMAEVSSARVVTLRK